MSLPDNPGGAGAPTPTSVVPTSFDHVALWVADREPLVDLLCRHLGMHVIDATDSFSLLGADARRGKLTLFDAPGPREPGVLGHVALRVADLDAALASLPAGLAVERHGSEAGFETLEGLRLALVERPGNDLDYDLDHVSLRVSDVERVAEGLTGLGLERHGGHLRVAGKEVRLQGGGAPEGERPLLNHLAVLVDSAALAEAEARRRGDEIASVVDAANTLAVFVWGPDRIKLEYVEHKPGFSLT